MIAVYSNILRIYIPSGKRNKILILVARAKKIIPGRKEYSSVQNAYNLFMIISQ